MKLPRTPCRFAAHSADAQLRYRLPFGAAPRDEILGAPAEVQTVALRCASAECAANRQGVRGNFTLSLAHSDRYLADGEAAATVTEPIAWGASEDDVRAALEDGAGECSLSS